MKPILKRIIASIMALCIVGLTCVATSAAQDNQDVSITILMDKPNYSASDTANVTVRVSNNSTNQLRDVVICVETDNWLLAKGSNSNIADIGSLDSGASREMSFSAVLNRNARGISFFSRIILFFKQIFSRPSSFSKMEYNNKDSVKSSANVSHGGASVKVTAACYYDTNMPDRFSERELKDMADVDKQIHNLIGTNAFQNDLNAVEQQNQVETLFDDLENKNLIEENSVNWDSESSTYTFTYSNGVLGAVMLAELSNEYNGPTTSNDVIEYDEVVLSSAPTNALSSNSIGDALILYAFNFPSDMQSFRNPFYNTTENDWENKGLDTTRDTYVTVNDLKNIDSKYEVIVFAGHGTTYNGTPSLCLTETVTKDNYQKYASDLKERRIAAVSYPGDKNGYYLAFPSLISSAYGASGLNGKFVYSESCCFMGEGELAKERYNYDFSNAFLNAGAQAAVGCHNSVDAVYSRDFMKSWVDSLIAEKTAKQSFDACVSRYGKDDSQSAYRSSHPGTPIAVPVFSGNENSKLAIQKEKYTVTFNANGGSVSPASSTVESGRSVTLPTPTRSYMITYNANSGTGAPSNQNLNASCKGWSTSSSATSSSYNCGSSYTPMSSITLYAVWGNATGNVTTAMPTRSGYSFAGWSTSSSANTVNYNPGSSISINKNTTLYAVWSKNPNTYTVSYNSNGGSGAPSSQTKTENINLTLSSTVPTRSGYNFLGWSTSSSATSATYSAGGTYTANESATLYAVWKAKTYTVSYNANGGSGAPSSQTKTHGQNLTLSSTKPSRSGYNFLGWSTSNSATSATYSAGGTYAANESVTLYAVWKKISYTLTYNANGGSGAPSSQTGNGTVKISSTVPTRSGYVFGGWSTAKNSSSSVYTSGSNFNLTENTTLYAYWLNITLSSTSGSASYRAITGGSSNIWRYTSQNVLGWSTDLPTPYNSTLLGNSAYWELVSGDGKIVGDTLYMRQPGTYKARYHIGNSTSQTYTFTLTYGKEVSTTQSNIIRSTPGGTDTGKRVPAGAGYIPMTEVQYTGSLTGSGHAWGKITYNGTTGWITICEWS